MLKIVTFSLIVGFFGTACSQNLDKNKLDQYFTKLDTNQKVMGSFAISKDDKIVYVNAIGSADLESKKEADKNTVYRIASISKTFTAVLIMKAVEEGKINLTEPINKFFPTVKNADKITIENLLKHRSGINNFTDNPNYEQYYENPITKKDLLTKIVTGGSDFEPNAKYSYSNSNYVLLGFMLEEIYRKPYAAILLEKISKPLGLIYTKAGEKINPKKNEANSYLLIDKVYHKSTETNLSVSIGSGNIVSTPSELLKFIIALNNGKIITKESLKKMQNFKDSYGLGITEVPFNTEKGFGHNGRIDEFLSVLYYFWLKSNKTEVCYYLFLNFPYFRLLTY